MPMTDAMARFAEVATLIRSRAAHDAALRDLCEDYRTARETLSSLKKKKPRPAGDVKEYTSLVEGLEEEIIHYLVNVGDSPRKK